MRNPRAPAAPRPRPALDRLNDGIAELVHRLAHVADAFYSAPEVRRLSAKLSQQGVDAAEAARLSVADDVEHRDARVVVQE